MGMLLLWCAASIIVPIIRAEGIIAVFFPFLVRQPQACSPPAHKPFCTMMRGCTQLTWPGIDIPRVCPICGALLCTKVSLLCYTL